MLKEQQKPKSGVLRVKLTTQVTLTAYDAIRKIQQKYRRKTGRHIHLWKIVDAAIRTYAREQGIKVDE